MIFIRKVWFLVLENGCCLSTKGVICSKLRHCITLIVTMCDCYIEADFANFNYIVSADITSQTRYARPTDIIRHSPARSSLRSSPAPFASLIIASRLYYCSALQASPFLLRLRISKMKYSLSTTNSNKIAKTIIVISLSLILLLSSSSLAFCFFFQFCHHILLCIIILLHLFLFRLLIA